jgi:hypothetical protein
VSGSLVHESLTALVLLWRAAAPPIMADSDPASGRRGVIDGPPYDLPERFLAVGWDRTEQPSVSAASVAASMSGTQSRESFDVSSLLSFAYDAAEVTTVRGQVMAAFDAFAAALAADQQMDGLVMQAQITGYDMTPILTESASVLDLRFTTHVEAMK